MIRSQRTASTVPNYLVLSIFAVFALMPVVMLFMNSIKSTGEIAQNPFGPPITAVFQNYPDAWEQGNFATTLGNSTILTVGTIIGTLVLAGLAAYALARLKLRGGDFIGFYFLVAVEVTSLLRKRISQRIWRLTHYLSFPLFLLTTVHGLSAGTDRSTLLLRWS